jgi:hypothetical protein
MDSTPILRASELPSGVTASQLRGRRFRRLSRDVYLPADADATLLTRCQALAQVLPTGSAFCLSTGARLLGLPVFDGERDLLHVAVPREVAVTRRQQVTAHGWWLPPEHVVLVQGVPVVSAARSFMDLAPTLRLEQLVAFGDAALRGGHATQPEIESIVTTGTRRRGILTARRAAWLLDARAESPPESIVRVWLHLSGLPAAEPNVVITDSGGRFVARVDLCIREYRLAVEYEGRYHRDADQYAGDLDRRNRLQQAGFLVVHLEQHMLRSPLTVVRPVAAALRAQGWTGYPDFAFTQEPGGRRRPPGSR